MSFEASRPDPARLVRMPFGDAWLTLVDPADLVTANPMDARVRMGMYRHLIEQLNPHGRFGRHDEFSPFWGYASQLAWQQRSGRLGGAGHVVARSGFAGPRSGAEGDAHSIADGSWWGACNFALSVVPYAAAMDLDLVPRIPVRVDGYAPVMPAWQSALRAMIARDADHDTVRVLVWAAHLASITLAVASHDIAFRALPAPERRFARGWVRMVDLFAAAAVRTDLDKLIETGGGALPPRMLTDGDSRADFHRYEASTVRRVGELSDRPSWRWGMEVRVWRRIMRTSVARADAEQLLAGMLGKHERWPAAMRALAYATLPARIVELARWNVTRPLVEPK